MKNRHLNPLPLLLVAFVVLACESDADRLTRLQGELASAQVDELVRAEELESLRMQEDSVTYFDAIRAQATVRVLRLHFARFGLAEPGTYSKVAADSAEARLRALDERLPRLRERVSSPEWRKALETAEDSLHAARTRRRQAEARLAQPGEPPRQ